MFRSQLAAATLWIAAGGLTRGASVLPRTPPDFARVNSTLLGTMSGASVPTIPLRVGLTVVYAGSSVRGDFESIYSITDVSSAGVSITASVEAPDYSKDDIGPLVGLLNDGEPKEKRRSDSVAVKHLSGRRTVRREDLQNAHQLISVIGDQVPENFAGATAVQLSTAVLNELRNKGETELTLWDAPHKRKDFSEMFESLPDSPSDLENQLIGLMKMSGTLKRAEPTSRLTVLVNDSPVELPAIRTRGRLTGTPQNAETELWVLDDPANPLVLKYSVAGVTTGQVIRISWDAADEGDARESFSTSSLSRALAKARRVTIYGIYFDFASDQIKKESHGILTRIAKVLRDNPTWSLGVEGHTDGIGPDQQNLELSRRRAAAVKQALTKQYGISPNRLTTEGYGKARPIERNDTLEGRARNRRVELVRQ